MDLNLTRLIHLLRANDNRKKSNNGSNDNSNSNSGIISLYYLIIERVFQIDGEYIVVWFSTLIDRKEQKIISSEHLVFNNDNVWKGKKDGKSLLLSKRATSNKGERDDENIFESISSIFIQEEHSISIRKNRTTLLMITRVCCIYSWNVPVKERKLYWTV